MSSNYLQEQQWFESLKQAGMIASYQYDAHNETWLIEPLIPLKWVTVKLTMEDAKVRDFSTDNTG